MNMKKLRAKIADGSIKPYRILWHTVSGLALFFAMMRTYPSKRLPITALAIFLLGLLLVDVLRFTSERGSRLFWKHLSFLASEKEKRGPNTSVFYAGSLLLSVIIFPARVAMGCVISLAVGDKIAGLVGHLFGRLKIWGKSVEGALANFLICFLILRSFMPRTSVAFTGAFTGALIEIVPIPKIDDNLSVPLASGIAMTIVSML